MWVCITGHSACLWMAEFTGSGLEATLNMTSSLANGAISSCKIVTNLKHIKATVHVPT